MTPRQAQFLQSLRHALGTPYVWGGASPGGFDCSGLIYWAARRAGIRNVPRTSQEQFHHGTPVPMNGLRPGDLVFSNWGGEQGAGHVSIYMGNGKILEASHTGTDVRILPFSVLHGHILGARRIIPNAAGMVENSSGFAQKQQAYYHSNPAAGFQMNANLMAQLRANAPQLQTAQQTLQKLNQPQPLQGLGLQQAPPAPLATGGLDTLHEQLLRAPSPLRPRLPVTRIGA